MRKLIHAAAGLSALLALPIAANAADLPPAPPPAAAPVYVPPPPFTWTGFYLGGNVGGAWANNNWTLTDPAFVGSFANGTSNGRFMGGGQLGFNYQWGAFVWGVEGDFDWGSNGSNNGLTVVVPAGPLTGDTLSVVSNNTWVTTIAARFGFAVDRALFYGKAGGGWVGNNGFTVTDLRTGNSVTGFNSNSQGGWLVGAGIEWAFAYNWTVKIEYDYLGLGSRTLTVPAGSLILANDTFTTSGSNNIQMVKLGVNYLFNWGSPVVARY
jgi:outer membrane immunogenic protein